MAQRLWEEGLFAERMALLAPLRLADPAAGARAARRVVEPGRAEDRLMFLDSLRAGLSEADEPFLEQALADRSRNVRSTAAELLSALPVSALAARMAARARSCVSLGPGRHRGGGAVRVRPGDGAGRGGREAAQRPG